jgi:ketosteroid isomerase-like protein
MNPDETVSTIREHEQKRCSALVANDRATLRDLIAEDLVHIHATGQIDDFESYVNGFLDRAEFLCVEREQLDVRAYGEVAVATGSLHQVVKVKRTGKIHDLNVITTQVWRKLAERWQQTSFHATTAPASK